MPRPILCKRYTPAVHTDIRATFQLERERLAALREAAPDLLASLIEMEATFGVDGHGGELEDGESALIDRARAAIAKARRTTGSPA